MATPLERPCCYPLPCRMLQSQNMLNILLTDECLVIGHDSAFEIGCLRGRGHSLVRDAIGKFLKRSFRPIVRGFALCWCGGSI